MSEENKVLVVDKRSEISEIATEASESSAWQLTVVSDAQEAIKAISNEPPDVIVLGYLEPRGEAFRLHKQLRENKETGNIPQVVVDVAPADQPSKGWRKDEGLRMDAECYLCLPLSSLKLGQAIDGILSGAEVLDTV